MKNIFMLLAATVVCLSSRAQNTFPSTGNVGIGTVSPTFSLDVEAANSSVQLRLGRTASLNGYADFGADNLGFHLFPSGYLNGEKMTILANGNVGIGRQTPLYKLQVNGDISVNSSSDYIYTSKIGSYTGDLTINAGGGGNNLILSGGKVGIGTSTPDQMLAVNGTVHAKEVKVDMTGWSDYVFTSNYHLPSLLEVKDYIDKNQHLPEIPSEQEIIKNGVKLGEMNKLLVKKIEELTLYVIEQQRQTEHIKKLQDERIAALEKALLNRR